MKPAARLAIWLAAGSVLGLVALTYLNPHLMVDLATRVWACL